VHPIRVKICGITRPEDAVLASRLGAAALGVVFYPGSKRAATVADAHAIREVMPAFVSLTALFVNPAAEEVARVTDQVRIDCLQFHGDETPEFCRSFGIPYIKALRVQEKLDVVKLAAQYPDAAAILLDSYDKDQAGGTGLRFDWRIAEDCVARCRAPVVLAGGLNADNVGEAIGLVRPYAVDVSSGVESVPGRKCPEKLQAFFNEVYRVQS
jgi:phosphoribosylanthranilate isomerase